MTHRQFVTWQEWIAIDMNTPSKDNFYSMRLAQRIQQGWAKDPNSVTIDQQRLEFETHAEAEKRKGMQKATREEREQASYHAKALWAKRVGGIAEVKKRTRAEAKALKPWDVENDKLVLQEAEGD